MKKIFMLFALLCNAPTYAINCLSSTDFVKHNTQWELTDDARKDWYIYQQNNPSESTSLIGAHLTVEINNSSRAHYLTCSYLLGNTSLLIKPINPRKVKGGSTFSQSTFSQFEPFTFFSKELFVIDFIVNCFTNVDNPTVTFYSCESSADQPEKCSWEWE